MFELSPKIGPISGGTKLSIIGLSLNIGSSISVYLDNFECIVNTTHTSSNSLTCVTSAAPHPSHIRSMRVQIDAANRTFSCLDRQTKNHTQGRQLSDRANNRILSERNNPSEEKQICSIFNYTSDPKILQVKPLKSFASGGRMLTVHGMNLDSIQKPDLEVFLADEKINKSTCIAVTKSRMECPSPAINSKFNEYKNKIEILQQLSTISTSAAFEIGYKNYSNDRHTRQADKLFITDDSISSSSPSIPWPSSSIIQSNIFTDGLRASTSGVIPSVATTIINNNDLSATLKFHEPQMVLQISFSMDNVQSVKDLNKHFPGVRSTITYVDDPIFFPFSNYMKLYKGDTLVIEGENLNIACDETDVVVTIGQEYCNVTSLALTQLVCTPPEHQPNPSNEDGIEVGYHFML